jgi:DNA-binding MarR family transcriptional regulator
LGEAAGYRNHEALSDVRRRVALSSLDFWVGLGVGVAASLVAVGLLWLHFSRQLRRRQGLGGPTAESNPALAELRGPPPASDPGPNPASPPSAATAPWPDLAAPPPVASASESIGPEPVRLSQRVLFHLAREGAGPPEGTVRHQLCQQGIAEALGVPQGAVSSVLRRLVAGGALVSGKAHVEGHDRRLKVYWFTPRGHEIVRRLLRTYPSSRGGGGRPMPASTERPARAPDPRRDGLVQGPVADRAVP